MSEQDKVAMARHHEQQVEAHLKLYAAAVREHDHETSIIHLGLASQHITIMRYLREVD